MERTFRRWGLVLAVGASGCGGVAHCERCGAGGGDAGAGRTVEAVEVPEAARGAGDAGGAETSQPALCVWVSAEARAAWPAIEEAVDEAHRRWGLSPLPQGENCALSVYADAVSDVGRTFRGDGVAGVHLNPGTVIPDSEECSGHHLALTEVLTHELGHAYGYKGHAESGAMGPHSWCRSVRPTEEERALLGPLGRVSTVGPLE